MPDLITWAIVVTFAFGPGASTAPRSVPYGFTDRAPCEAYREHLAPFQKPAGGPVVGIGECEPSSDRAYRELVLKLGRQP